MNRNDDACSSRSRRYLSARTPASMALLTWIKMKERPVAKFDELRKEFSVCPRDKESDGQSQAAAMVTSKSVAKLWEACELAFEYIKENPSICRNELVSLVEEESLIVEVCGLAFETYERAKQRIAAGEKVGKKRKARFIVYSAPEVIGPEHANAMAGFCMSTVSTLLSQKPDLNKHDLINTVWLYYTALIIRWRHFHDKAIVGILDITCKFCVTTLPFPDECTVFGNLLLDLPADEKSGLTQEDLALVDLERQLYLFAASSMRSALYDIMMVDSNDVFDVNVLKLMAKDKARKQWRFLCHKHYIGVEYEEDRTHKYKHIIPNTCFRPSIPLRGIDSLRVLTVEPQEDDRQTALALNNQQYPSSS
jgi:hypothetical protein